MVNFTLKSSMFRYLSITMWWTINTAYRKFPFHLWYFNLDDYSIIRFLTLLWNKYHYSTTIAVTIYFLHFIKTLNKQIFIWNIKVSIRFCKTWNIKIMSLIHQTVNFVSNALNIKMKYVKRFFNRRTWVCFNITKRRRRIQHDNTFQVTNWSFKMYISHI